MNINETLSKINNVKTMPELDALRRETADAMMSGDENTFNTVQGAFRKAINRLRRIPLKDRDW